MKPDLQPPKTDRELFDRLGGNDEIDETLVQDIDAIMNGRPKQTRKV